MLNKCKKCLYDEKHPFHLCFDEGICSGCFTHEEKYEINWDKKEEELKELVKEAKKNAKVYDCVLPIIGDAEDYYVLKKVLGLGLNPLIVCVNDYFKNDIAWHNLHNLITYFDVDSFIYNPDIRVYKELIRTALRKYDSMYLPFLSLHTSFVVHIAKEREIPLVIWGGNQSIEQAGKFSHHDKVQMSKWSRKEHDLFGQDIKSFIGNGAQVQTKDLYYYKYPDISSLNKTKKNVKGIYLSNYFLWDPLKQNHSILDCGFIPQENPASFDIYERAGSSTYYQIHDLLKYKKLGYRKITDHLSREIRHKRVDRKTALEIEKHYTNSKVDVYAFFKWLGMSDSGIKWFILHQLKGLEHLIGKEEQNKIKLPKAIDQLLIKGSNPKKEFLSFAKGIEI